nr:putative RNA-directed DNA polymerase, eukaryota, reverse transcriptase zinc-binding domain protein [Tanacetum cinerariifolium]
MVYSRNPDLIFRDKLKNVKEGLKAWSKVKFGGNDRDIDALKNEATKWEIVAESRDLDVVELERWKEARIQWIEKDNLSIGSLFNTLCFKWGSGKNGANGSNLVKLRLHFCSAEGLNVTIKEAVSCGYFNGVKIGSSAIRVSHLQYADDTFIFGEGEESNARNLMRIMECVKQASGLKINSNKTKVNGIGVQNGEIEDFANRMGISPGKMPFTYLGIQIGINIKRVDSWKIIVEKFKKGLGNWKTKMISFGRRLTLVKSVLGSLALYFFSLFRAPMSVLKNLESMRSNFFWGGDDENRKMAWVKWDVALNKLALGDLDIGSLKASNWALVGKWWWRFRVEGDRLWVRIIKSIYGEDGGFRVEDGNNRLIGGKWGEIVKVGRMIDKTGVNFCNSFVKKVGGGNSTLFWLDSWVGNDIILSVKFPRLYRLEMNQQITVGEKRIWVEGSWGWHWDWAKNLEYLSGVNVADEVQLLFGSAVIEEPITPLNEGTSNQTAKSIIEWHVSALKELLKVPRNRDIINPMLLDFDDVQYVSDEEIKGDLKRKTKVDEDLSKPFKEHSLRNLSNQTPAALTTAGTAGGGTQQGEPKQRTMPEGNNEIYYHSGTITIQHHFGASGSKATQSYSVHHPWDDKIPNPIGNCNTDVPSTYNIRVHEGRKEVKRSEETKLQEKVSLTEQVLVNPAYTEQLVVIRKGISPKGSMQFKNLLKKNKYIFAWEPADMTGVPKRIIKHSLNVNPSVTPVSQKMRVFCFVKSKVITKEVAEWLKAGIVRPIDRSWRMCIDFKNINSACPKDYYPLPEINSKIDSVVGFSLKCFLDAYKDYHQIQMAEEEGEKTAFYTDQGTYCYTKMSFGLKNVGATYQRLVDEAFQSQIGRNMEVYVDDMVVKTKKQVQKGNAG